MRIGEFKQIVDRALTEDNQLSIDATSIYEGQAYRIQDFSDLFHALRLFIDEDWNNLDHKELDAVLNKYAGNEKTVEMSTNDYNILNGYVSGLNNKLPIAMNVIDAWSPEQDKYAVNIMLPEGIKNLEDLQKFNERIIKIFKKFSITGEFTFEGFDSGSDWYQIVVTTEELYKYVMAGIGLATAVLAMRKTYYDSETSKLAYKAAKRKDDQITESKYLKDLEEEKIEDDSKDLVNSLGEPDSRSKDEMISITIGAVKELIKELDRGTEFHMSLSPPDYMKDGHEGKIDIDYKSIPKIEKPEKETKELKEKSESQTNDEKEEPQQSGS